MHRRRVLAAAFVAVAATGTRPLAAQTGFEGVITFTNYEHGGKPTTFVQTSKGRKLRLDGFGSDSGSMILDNDAKSIVIVEPAKKQYMSMTQDDMKQMQAMMGPMMERMKQKRNAEGKSGKFKFAPTGKSETVAGTRCEVWHGEYLDTKGEKEEGEACVATGVGFALGELTFNNPMLMSGGAANEQFEQYRDLVGTNKGILKATKIENGQVKPQLEATKIERKSVGDDAFKPPADYKEIRMGDMMMKAHEPMDAQHKKPQADQ
jgi:hypothetical protein